MKARPRSGWLKRHPTLADGALALTLLVFSLPTASTQALEDGFRRPNGFTFLFVVLQTLPITWRRRAPLPVLGITALALCAHSAFGFQPTLSFLGPLVAAYTVVAIFPRPPRSVAALVVSGVAVLASPILYDGRIEPEEFGGALFLFAIPWFVGNRIYRQRAYTAGLEERAAQLERDRKIVADEAVIAERARIARELHDVVAHAISVVVVQAGAARRVLHGSPERADESIAAIESVGRQALAEMRRLLEVLRRDHEQEAFGPQPGVDRLAALAKQVQEAGLPVELSIEGDVRPLPASIDLSAYRIVQEALTNSLKHAGPARAQVLVRYGAEELELAVSDDGQRLPPPRRNGSGGGHGLIGMRERVSLLGGSFSAGPLTGGGFKVRAVLPIGEVQA